VGGWVGGWWWRWAGAKAAAAAGARRRGGGLASVCGTFICECEAASKGVLLM
jgi:hypothetical protein